MSLFDNDPHKLGCPMHGGAMGSACTCRPMLGGSLDDPKECADDDHDWKHQADSDGDADVINGTRMFCWMECETCGKQMECDGSWHDNESDYMDAGE